jgi:hypothetical protein
MKEPKLPDESPTGWWVVGILMENQGTGDSNYWEIMMIFTGKRWREVYGKAVAYGKRDEGGGTQKFRGITNLFPVYDDFKDGAEILFTKLSDDSCLKTLYTEEKLAKRYG